MGTKGSGRYTLHATRSGARQRMMRLMRRLLASIFACTLGTVEAAERNPLEAKAVVDIGWFFLSTDIRVRVDGETIDASGTDIEYDDTFGIGDFDRLRAEALWRIAPRHTLRGMYFENNRSATRSLDRDIVFGGSTFPVSASVTARSEITVAQLSYEYGFLRGNSYELAAGIGVHYVDMGLSLAATLNGPTGSLSGAVEESASTQAPLPVVGLRGLWRLSDDLYITGQLQYFYLDLKQYSGSLMDLKAALVWQFTDHVGIGVAYNDFGFRFDIEDRHDFEGRLRWNYGGAIAFATVMF
jgi:hypothetical protein